MARKQIIFIIMTLLIVFSLPGNVKGQTPVPIQNNFFYQYLPLISVPSSYDVYLKSSSEYIEGTNHYVVGELLNQSNTMYYDAGVTVEIKGQNIGTYRTIRTFIRCINPHQTTPFKVVFNGLLEPANVSHISWSYQGISPEYPPCQSAQIDSQNYHDNYGTSFYICVSNINQKPMYGLSIVITLYDSSGKVVGVEKNAFPVYFPSGSHDSYCPWEGVYTPFRADQFSSFKAQAEGFTSEGNTFP